MTDYSKSKHVFVNPVATVKLVRCFFAILIDLQLHEDDRDVGYRRNRPTITLGEALQFCYRNCGTLPSNDGSWPGEDQFWCRLPNNEKQS